MKSVAASAAAAVAADAAPTRQDKRLRRSADGGYARGDETRLRIITAAMQLFGERGFDGASTRDIAAAANVNAPALQYYFHNKEGVYLACVEHIIEDVRAVFAPAFQRAEEVLRGEASMAELIDAFLGIYAVMLDTILAQPQAAQRRLFISREFGGEEPTVASRLLQRRLRGPLTKVSEALVARICGLAADDTVVRIRLMSLKGQIMPMHHSPRLALESLGWTKLDAPKLALLKTHLIAQARVLLEAWAGDARR